MRAGWTIAGLVAALLAGVAIGYFIADSAEPPGLEAATALGGELQGIYEGPDGTEKLSALMELYSDDSIIDDRANGDHFEGKDDAQWANQVFLATPDLDMEVERFIAGDGVLAMVWTATGSDSTDDGFSLPGVSVFELDGDLIGHEYYYYDGLSGPQ